MTRSAFALTLTALLTLAAAAPAVAQTYVGPADFPSVDFGRLMPGDPVPGQPGATFAHTGQGWIVVASPAPSSTGPTLPALQLPPPPTADEWVTVRDPNFYGGYPFTYIRRTADRAQWLVLGLTYTGPYQFQLRPLTVAPSPTDGKWYVLSELRSPGGEVTLTRHELYAPRGVWAPVAP